MEKFTKNNNKVADNKKGTMLTLNDSLKYIKDVLFDDIREVAAQDTKDVDRRTVWNYGGKMEGVPFANTEFWTVNRFVIVDRNTNEFVSATLNIIALNSGVPAYNITAKYTSDDRKAQIGIVAIDPVRGPMSRSRYKENVTF
nr:MAG TPA: hypothetical protein [Caudoviricetes sp.]